MDLLAELYTVYIYIYIYIYIDSIRDSLNKKAVRTLKACELYLFDFDVYTCMYMYLVSFNFYTYLPLATPICCNLFLCLFLCYNIFFDVIS